MTRSSDAEPVERLTWPSVLAWRMGRHALGAHWGDDDLLGVAGAISGLHAQLMGSAELTAWARVEALERDAVVRALWRERTLVKTWAMRGTLHLLPSEELPLWTAALAELKPRHHTPAWLRHHGLTREGAEAMLAAISAALRAQALTREELAREVARITGEHELEDRLRGGFGDLLKPAAFAGELCFAPSDGQKVRFTRPQEWLGAWKPVEPEVARREVARRYLSAYGPATREWFARWFGMTSAPQAERWIRTLGHEVVAVEVEGTRAWLLAADVEEVRSAEPSGSVALVPAFDAYVVGAPRGVEAVLAEALRERVYRRQGWLSPALVIDGVIAGVWRHERAGGRLSVEVEPFGALLPEAVGAMAEEVARLGRFLGLEADLDWQ